MSKLSDRLLRLIVVGVLSNEGTRMKGQIRHQLTGSSLMLIIALVLVCGLFLTFSGLQVVLGTALTAGGCLVYIWCRAFCGQPPHE